MTPSGSDLKVVHAMAGFFANNPGVLVAQAVGYPQYALALAAMGGIEAALVSPEWAAAVAHAMRGNVDREAWRQAALRLIEAVPVSMVHPAPGEGEEDG